MKTAPKKGLFVELSDDLDRVLREYCESHKVKAADLMRLALTRHLAYSTPKPPDAKPRRGLQDLAEGMWARHEARATKKPAKRKGKK